MVEEIERVDDRVDSCAFAEKEGARRHIVVVVR